MLKRKASFFERLTGSVNIDDFDTDTFEETDLNEGDDREKSWMEEENEGGELAIDVFQDSDNIIVKTMIAGVSPNDLDVEISRDMVTIRGTREDAKTISEDDYYHKELYWGTFSRTILLPQEVEAEQAEAVEKHGLLVITLPKIDKQRKQKIKVKTG